MLLRLKILLDTIIRYLTIISPLGYSRANISYSPLCTLELDNSVFFTLNVSLVEFLKRHQNWRFPFIHENYCYVITSLLVSRKSNIQRTELVFKRDVTAQRGGENGSLRIILVDAMRKWLIGYRKMCSNRRIDCYLHLLMTGQRTIFKVKEQENWMMKPMFQ